MWRSIVLITLTTGCLMAACPLSGGGGGTSSGGRSMSGGCMMRPPEPTWTSASKIGERIHVYAFTAENGTLPACWSSDIKTVSRSVPHVKVDAQTRQDLVERFGVEALPAVVVADPHGNPLARFQRRVPAKALEAAVEQAPVRTRQLAEEAARRLEDLEERYREKGIDHRLIAGLSVIASVRGHPAGREAEQLLGSINDELRSTLASINEDAASDPLEARRELRQLARRARGTPVEEEAEEAIAQLR